MYKERLKNLREDNELKQHDLAKLLNFHNNSYGQFEREETIIPLIHLNTICNYFNVSIDYIFNFTNTLSYNDFKKEIDKNIFKIRLKEFRKKRNLTQAKLASILNTTQSVIADYEAGRKLIATPFLYTICKKYDVSADYLLGKIDE